MFQRGWLNRSAGRRLESSGDEAGRTGRTGRTLGDDGEPWILGVAMGSDEAGRNGQWKILETLKSEERTGEHVLSDMSIHN